MVGQFVNNLAPGNFGTPGVYVYNAPNQQITPTGPALGKLGVIGTAQWGALNTPTLCTNAQSLYAAFGPNTALTNSLVRDAYASMPECNQVVGSRVTDGTDASATMVLLDASAGMVATFTAKFTGSLPNGVNALGVVSNPAQVVVTQVAGQMAASGTVTPVARVTLTFPNQPAEVFNGIVCGTASAGYVKATFQANLLAAVNVGTALNAPSQRWTATAGSSTITPVVGTAYSATGGLDGATFVSGITQVISTLLGVDGVTGRTGMYALRGAINGAQFIFAGYAQQSTGDTLPQSAVAFNNSEGTRAGFSFAQGTTTSTAQTVKAANSASDPTLDTFIDWIQQTDPWLNLAVYVAPHAKGMGIISSLDFYQSPLNKPVGGGAIGVLQTERYQNGINLVSGGEASTRYSAGLNYLSKPTGVWALSSDKASDAKTLVSDARAAWFFGVTIMSIVAPFLGQPQSNAINDPTRLKVRGAINAFMMQQFSPVQKIGSTANNQPAYSLTCDTSNNTPTTVAQGFLNVNLAVQTLGNVEIVLVQNQVGVTVTMTTPAQ